MNVLSPALASAFADEIYDVQDKDFLDVFVGRPELSGGQSERAKLTANIGALAWRVTDAFGVFARGSGVYKDDLFLVFRGTSEANKKADWASNLNVGVQMSQTGLPVHSGFNKVFVSMLPGIREFLAKHTTATGTIHCVGHSLGGAVANLAADWVKKHRGGSVKLYTFGAPRPGLAWFARSIGSRVQEGNIYRVYHKTDPVPMIPIFPFTHAPLTEYGHQIHSSETIVSREAHGIGRYRTSVRLSDWTALHGPLAPFHIDHVVEQWLKSDLAPNRADSRIWEWLNAAMIWVLKTLLSGTTLVVQTVFTGTFTLVDRLAWLLKTGVDLTEEGGYWVGRLMRKILQVLGMAVEATGDLTQGFIRQVLMGLMERLGREAQAALRRLVDRN